MLTWRKKLNDKETCIGANREGTKCINYTWPYTFETNMSEAGLLTTKTINGVCAENEAGFCGDISGNPVIYFDKGCQISDAEPCGVPLFYENNEDKNLTKEYINVLPQHECNYWSGCEDVGLTKEIFDTNPECKVVCNGNTATALTTNVATSCDTINGGCKFDVVSPSKIDFSSWDDIKKTEFVNTCKGDVVILPEGDCKSTECTGKTNEDIFCGDDVDKKEAIGYKNGGNKFIPVNCCDGKKVSTDTETFEHGECVYSDKCNGYPAAKDYKAEDKDVILCNDGFDNDCTNGFDRTETKCGGVVDDTGYIISGNTKCEILSENIIGDTALDYKDKLSEYGFGVSQVSETKGLCTCQINKNYLLDKNVYDEGKILAKDFKVSTFTDFSEPIKFCVPVNKLFIIKFPDLESYEINGALIYHKFSGPNPMCEYLDIETGDYFKRNSYTEGITKAVICQIQGKYEFFASINLEKK